VLSPSSSDRGQLIRNIPVLGGIDDIEGVIGDFSRRNKPIARVVMMPSAFDPEAHPESILMRAKRLGLIVSRLPSLESGDVPRLTAVAVEDLLLRPSESIDYARLEALVKNKAVIVTGGGGSIGSEICERVVTFGAGAASGDRALGARPVRGGPKPSPRTAAAPRSRGGLRISAIASVSCA